MQAPGCSGAGNGFRIRRKCRCRRLNATRLTWSVQSPTLQIETRCCSRRQHFTPPNIAEPDTASLPGGARPVMVIVAGLAGSLLVTVTVAEAGPRLAGWNRMGTLIALPASIVSGKDSTSGSRKLPAEEVIAVTESVQPPLLESSNGSSTNEPTQHGPKLPLSAIASASRCAGAKPETGTVAGLAGSLLKRSE